MGYREATARRHRNEKGQLDKTPQSVNDEGRMRGGGGKAQNHCITFSHHLQHASVNHWKFQSSGDTEFRDLRSYMAAAEKLKYEPHHHNAKS